MRHDEGAEYCCAVGTCSGQQQNTPKTAVVVHQPRAPNFEKVFCLFKIVTAQPLERVPCYHVLGVACIPARVDVYAMAMGSLTDY